MQKRNIIIKLLFFILFSGMIFPAVLYAEDNSENVDLHKIQNSNELQIRKLSELERQQRLMKKQFDNLLKEKGRLEHQLRTIKEQLAGQQKSINALSAKIGNIETHIVKKLDELLKLSNSENSGIASVKESIGLLGSKIDEKTEKSESGINDLRSDVIKKSNITIGILLFIIVIFVGIALYLYLKFKFAENDYAVLKKDIVSLHDDIVENKTIDLSRIEELFEKMNSSSISDVTEKKSDSGQPLIMALADKITFMEMTLYRMDPAVRGYKQLSKAISQIKDNLAANDYEIVDMLGKPYIDGMKAVANFNDDESLEKGTRIITGVIKPQINYKGVMIQAAQISVSQNI